MSKIFWRAAATAAVTLLSMGAASAQSFPTSIATTWTIRANDTTPFTFTISAQNTSAPCAVISGVLGSSNDTINGYYCPATGSVSFLRNSVSTGATYQVYTGQVSFAGSQTYMTGNFSNYAGGTDTGAYGFTASASGL